MLNELKELAKVVYVAPYHFGIIYAAIGDVEASRKALWASYEERSSGLLLAKNSPYFDCMRSDPVFDEIVRKIGLP
jgi:hypothetical protein